MHVEILGHRAQGQLQREREREREKARERREARERGDKKNPSTFSWGRRGWWFAKCRITIGDGVGV